MQNSIYFAYTELDKININYFLHIKISVWLKMPTWSFIYSEIS